MDGPAPPFPVGFGPPGVARFGQEFGGGFRHGGGCWSNRPVGFGRCVIGFILRNKKIIFGIAAVAVCYKIYKFRTLQNRRAIWNAAGKDIVVLHTLPRGRSCISLTPFSVKLETFFRMMNIRYVLDLKDPMGPTNKVPWITFNKVDYYDSELIIEMLQKKFDKRPDENVPKQDLAIGLSMRIMMEEHFYWAAAHWRYIVDECYSLFEHHNFPFLLRFLFKYKVTRMVKDATYAQGIGRHTNSDINMFMKKDLEALSVYLGDKPFLYGDEPHVVDCAIFAMLSQALYNMPRSVMALYITEDFKNLKAYTGRMKAKFWPDWNRLITSPPLTG